MASFQPGDLCIVVRALCDCEAAKHAIGTLVVLTTTVGTGTVFCTHCFREFQNRTIWNTDRKIIRAEYELKKILPFPELETETETIEIVDPLFKTVPA